MSLEQDILQQVASASDEAALEALRVATLGKKGSISEQMKTLGAMGPEERKTAGAALNVLKDKVTEAIAARKAVLQEAQLEQRLASEKIDVTSALETRAAYWRVLDHLHTRTQRRSPRATGGTDGRRSAARCHSPIRCSRASAAHCPIRSSWDAAAG